MRKKTSILAIMAIIMMLIIVGCNIDSLILKDPVIQTSRFYGEIAVNILIDPGISLTLDGRHRLRIPFCIMNFLLLL